MQKIFIYSLTDPRDGLIKYIGKTIDLKRRFKEHLKEEGKYKKIRWIKKLLKLNLVPKIDIIDIVWRCDEDFWEMFWISQFRYAGFKLLNHTNGGHNPPIVKKFGEENSFKIPSVKVKILEMNHARKGKTYEELYGKYKSKKLRKQTSNRTKGVKNPMYGKNQTKETKVKISNANSGKRNGMYGKIVTEETKNLIRSKLKGRIVKEETKLKISNSKKGKPRSEKTKQKLRLFSGEKNKNFRGVVYQYDKLNALIKVWKGLFEIKIIFGNKFSNISSCLTGKLKSAYGFIWTRHKFDNNS